MKEYIAPVVIALVLVVNLFVQFLPKDLALALLIIVTMGFVPRNIWNG